MESSSGSVDRFMHCSYDFVQNAEGAGQLTDTATLNNSGHVDVLNLGIKDNFPQRAQKPYFLGNPLEDRQDRQSYIINGKLWPNDMEDTDEPKP